MEELKAKEGEWVYILSNPSMPNLFKIGRTNSIKTRMADLSCPSGIPTAFKLVYSAKVSNATLEEKRVHADLKDVRIAKNREFFRSNSRINITRRVREVLGDVIEEKIDTRIKKKVLGG